MTFQPGVRGARSAARCAVVAFFAACGMEAPARPAAEVLDSAGVRVVVNAEPRPEADPRWLVAPEPAVEIGVVDGAPEYQLYRVSGGVVLSDGTIVVADRGSQELRFYDPAGRHVRSVGGEGDGPGEADIRVPSVAGVLAGGWTVVRQGAVHRAGQAVTGVDRANVTLYLARPDGTLGDSLGTFPGLEAYVVSEERMMSVRSLVFGRGLEVSASGDRVAVGNNDGFSVRVHDAGGTLLHVVRQTREPGVVTDEFDAYVAEQLAEIDSESPFLQQTRLAFEQMPRHETFPAYGDLLVDREGNLWVQEYERPGAEQRVWQVFDREGVVAARVETPPGLSILDVG